MCVNLGVFCKMHFKDTKGTYETRMRGEATKFIERAPWTVLSFTEIEWRQLLNTIESPGDHVIKHVRVMENMEIEIPSPIVPNLIGENLINKDTNQVICTAPYINKMPILDKCVSVDHPPLL